MATPPFPAELSNREFFIQRWEQEYPAFVRVFKSLPADRMGYRPHPRSRSAGELVALLLSSQKSCMGLCRSPKTMYNGMRWEEPGAVGNLTEMIAAYEADHALFRAELRQMSDTDWNDQAWLLGGPHEILLKYTVGGLLWIALFDFVHHRGQLSTYIRPMGGDVPSIYGPSADEDAAGGRVSGQRK
jgi:uncharacterized damage-inducible protein DinB